MVDGEAQNFKLNLDTEDLSKAAVGADDLNFESGYLTGQIRPMNILNKLKDNV